MKLSFLIKFLEGEESVLSLREQLAAPLKEYRGKSTIVGASCSVVIYSDISGLTISREHVIKLCDAYLLDQLDEVEVDYLGSGLQLVAAMHDFQFESDRVEGALSFLCDPQVNGPLTMSIVQKIKEMLQQKK